MHFLLALREQLILGFGELQFDVSKNLRHSFAQGFQHRLEQIEGFVFVLVQGIALTISTQINALSQMVEVQQVLLPQLVEQLQ